MRGGLIIKAQIKGDNVRFRIVFDGAAQFLAILGHLYIPNGSRVFIIRGPRIGSLDEKAQLRNRVPVSL
jgi:hypothetical protein